MIHSGAWPKNVGKRYNLTLPSACHVRKISVMSVAISPGDSSQAHPVTRQMSHYRGTLLPGEIRNKRLTGPMKEVVSRALSHSLGTAQQYYQAPTLKDAYGAYSVCARHHWGVTAVSPVLERELDATEQREAEKSMEEEIGPMLVL